MTEKVVPFRTQYRLMNVATLVNILLRIYGNSSPGPREGWLEGGCVRFKIKPEVWTLYVYKIAILDLFNNSIVLNPISIFEKF